MTEGTLTARPAITLGWLRSWAARNDVPPASVLKDQRGYLIACFWAESGRVAVIPSPVTDQGKTLADLMAWAELEPDVKDEAPLFLRTPFGYFDVVDLGRWEGEPGLHLTINPNGYLTLQEVRR